MLKGIQLTLLIGPMVPRPAPKAVIDALTGVQVSNSKDRSGFQLRFTVGKNSTILTSLLPSGFFDPISTRVIIVVTLNGSPNVLIDGLVTNHELAPANEAGTSTLTITGEDLSIAMDLVQNIIPYPAMPDIAKVGLLLAPYAVLGIKPIIIPPISMVLKSPTQGFDTQSQTTDRAYIRSLAQRNGYVFYIQPGLSPGSNFAYFGPDISLPIHQSALSVNLDAHSNVDSLSFSLDGLAKRIKVYTILDPFTKKIPIPIPLPNINPIKPPLGQRPIPPAKVEFAEDGSKLTVGEAARDILGFLLGESTAAVTANGSLDVLRYNKFLRARMLVGVRGAGAAYDGNYYVDSVTHDIKPGAYTQSFSLSRDGLLARSSTVAM